MICLKRTSPDENIWGPVAIHTPSNQPPKYIDIDRRAEKSKFGCIVGFHGIKTTFYKRKHGNGKRMTFFVPAENKLSLAKGWYSVDMSNNDENLNDTIDSKMEFILIRKGHQRSQYTKLRELKVAELDHL